MIKDIPLPEPDADSKPFWDGCLRGELEEDPGLRMVGNVRGCSNDELRFDVPVEVWFEQVAEDVALPQWQPRA